MGNPDFVNLLYRNGLEREADAPGRDFWTGGLQRGTADRGGVALAISESTEGVASPLTRGVAQPGTGTGTDTGTGTTGTGTSQQISDGTGTGTGQQTADGTDTGSGTGLGDASSFSFVQILTPDDELLTVRVVGEDLPVGSEVVSTATAGGTPDGVLFLDDAQEEAASLSSPDWFMG